MSVKVKYGPSIREELEGDQFAGKTVGQLRSLLSAELGIDPRSPARIKMNEEDEGRPVIATDVVPQNCILEFGGYANMNKG